MSSTRRNPTLGTLAATLVIAAVLAVTGGAGASGGDNVLVFGHWGTTSDASKNMTVSRLRSLEHHVTVADALPADLSAFDSVWFVGLQPLAAAEADALVAYLHAGGGVYLAGESSFNATWVALDASLQPVLDGALGAGGAVAHGAGVAGPYVFNEGAVGDIAVGFGTLPGVTSSVGRLTGVSGANVLLAGTGGVPVAGVWDGAHVAGGGRLVVLMDLTWITVAPGTTATPVVDRIQTFLGGTNSPPVVSAGEPVSATEGGAATVTGSAVDPDDDPLALEWTWAPGAGVDEGASCSFGSPAALTTSVSCTDDGTFILTLTASDGVNAPVAASTSFAVTNVPPHVAVASPGAGAAVAAGTPLDVLATVVDPGGDSVVCAFDWGDGTESTVPAAAGVCGAAHTYPEAAMRTVTVTATDDDGGSASASFPVAVFDPAGGWVTGGGTVGAGGSFALSVRYPPGESRPRGTFRWSEGRHGATFVASGFDWMVVGADGPDGAVVLEGTGSIGDSGGHRFRLTGSPGRGANDATLELQVWPGPGDGAAWVAAEGVATVRGALTVHH